MSEVEEQPPLNPPVSKSEVIQKIARTLQERRSSRSLSIEKVSQILKIRLPYMQAIEKGEWDQLPGEVYVRGFIRRYAQYLGLNGDQLMAPYMALVESPVPDKTSAPPPVRHSDFNRAQFLWAVVVIVFIIGFLKVLKQQRTASVHAPAASVPATAVKDSSAPVQAEAPKAEVPAAVSAKHQIQVFSSFPLWLRVTASDKNFEGFIPQATSWTWKGEGVFQVKLGHSKQVTIQFDGKDVPLKEDQQKITLPAE
jgi:cytoskeletal protein RodZ